VTSIASLRPTPPAAASSRALVARDLVKGYAGRPVLDGLDLVAPPGRILAVIGENGSGKSTLLGVLTGRVEPDAGTIDAPEDLGHLPQEPEFGPGATVGSVLHDALAPLHELVALVEELAGRLADPGNDATLLSVGDTGDPAAAAAAGDGGAAAAYARVLERAVLADAWDADRRAQEAAARLGTGALAPDRPVTTLSGGQRSRLALAALLTRRPACLVLDEPTNHLDDAAVGYVERVLTELPGVVVVASHDRVFLDRVADQVLDLDAGPLGSDGQGGRSHGLAEGGYSGVLEARAASRRRWEELHAQQQADLATLRRTVSTTARQVAHGRPPRDNDKFIHHMKGQNVERTVSRRVRDAERRLAELEAVQVPRPPAPLSFTSWLAPRGSAEATVRGLVVPGRLSLPRLDVAPGDHLLVTGGNGSGKSTLLAVLAARTRDGVPRGTTGTVRVRARRVGHLPQDVAFPDGGRSALEVYADAAAGVPGRPVALTDLGLLHPRDAHRPVGQLSLGQQRRLALALVIAQRPDLVLLDEPTNHLSLALCDELEDALGASPGTVVVASHDRWLRQRWPGRQVVLG
jgi:macrolide transport system ATP-binding/permease protein